MRVNETNLVALAEESALIPMRVLRGRAVKTAHVVWHIVDYGGEIRCGAPAFDKANWPKRLVPKVVNRCEVCFTDAVADTSGHWDVEAMAREAEAFIEAHTHRAR